MRRLITIVVAAVACTVMLASMTRAQLHRRSPQTDSGSGPARPDARIPQNNGVDVDSASTAGTSDPRPSVPARPARYLLRNGLDFLRFHQPQRAWEFFQEARVRQAELTEEERQTLDQAIRQTREALASAGSNASATARPHTARRDADAQTARTAARALSTSPSRRSSEGETSIHLPPLPAPESIDASQVRMTRYQESPALPPVPALVPDPSLGGPTASAPNFAPTPGGAGALNAGDGLPQLPETAGADNPEPPAPAPVGANIGGDPLPPLPDEAASSSAPAPAPVPAPAPAPAIEPPAEPAPMAQPTLRVSREEPEPKQESEPSFLRGGPESTLPSEIQRDVERIARQQRNELRADDLPDPLAESNMASDNPSTANQQLFQPRPPSPTEPRPLRGITAPEEFVPLAPRQWQPYRKHWAASATCHSTLYFQDPVLERYGQSMETKLGHAGHYLSYPIDDPKQSNQRMQFAQPFFSAGLFGFQVVTLPVKLILDPPWEAEYDLGYYRPGDRVPPDLYYLPITGIGPPLAGKNY